MYYQVGCLLINKSGRSSILPSVPSFLIKTLGESRALDLIISFILALWFGASYCIVI